MQPIRIAHTGIDPDHGKEDCCIRSPESIMESSAMPVPGPAPDIRRALYSTYSREMQNRTVTRWSRMHQSGTSAGVSGMLASCPSVKLPETPRKRCALPVASQPSSHSHT